MSDKTQPKTFVYGIFRWAERPWKPGTSLEYAPVQPIGSRTIALDQPEIAVEILREFGTTELRGKIYYRVGNTWAPVHPDRARSNQFQWFNAFEQSSKDFVFDMQSSGAWEVLYFRTESDETGGYLSVALRLLPELPAFLALYRKAHQ
jgi:hypothetical protein